MSRHPYRDAPGHAFWKNVVTPDALPDPCAGLPAFRIARSDKVATAGSCFAQHVSRALRRRGLHFLDAEPAHPLLKEKQLDQFGYRMFSARYGNIYTTRQLLQLFERAFGHFTPAERAWRIDDGNGFVDPFRPAIQRHGFPNEIELAADRAFHLGCVRRVFQTLDVFVFTLGLTESWTSRRDGSVFPLCPGVVGGRFDPDLYAFVNFDVGRIVDDMTTFIDRLRAINPGARLIITVSPVPLAATATGGNVMAATMYSKSVLRVACEEILKRRPGVAYFPSFEMVTMTFGRESSFDADGRTVLPKAVEAVMDVFMRHFTEAASHGEDAAAADDGPSEASEAHRRHGRLLERAAEVNCDEEALSAFGSAATR